LDLETLKREARQLSRPAMLLSRDGSGAPAAWYFESDLNVVVNDYIGDRTVCVTNPNDLDEETLRKLKLID
jgi:hypothetical protein